MTRRMAAVVVGVVASLLIASSASAFECTNASKPAASGAQVVIGSAGQILYITPGLQERIDRGIVDGETGEGYHGILAFDLDGDNVADASIYFGVGPDGEIPLEAQFRGPACRGLTNIGILLTQCL
jgi:hypothetical protein